MELLFKDSLAPITSRIGFLGVDARTAADAYDQWMTPILREYGFALERARVGGDLRTVLLGLQPLTSPIHTKFLFVPTASRWTAFFDNGWRGADTSSPLMVLCRNLGCPGLSFTAVTQTLPAKTTKDSLGRYGATILEIYGTSMNHTRTVYAANDGGRWVFGTSGEPLEFEDVSAYKARRIRDRFTPEMLRDYLRALEIDAFSETFYLPRGQGSAEILTKTGTFPASFKEYTLSQARETFGEQ